MYELKDFRPWKEGDKLSAIVLVWSLRNGYEFTAKENVGDRKIVAVEMDD